MCFMALRLQEALRQDCCPLSSGRTGHCSSSTLPLTLKSYFLLYSICTILHQKIKKNAVTFSANWIKHPKLLQDFDEETHNHQHSNYLQPIQTQHLGGCLYMSSPTVPPSRGWSETGQQHDRTQSEHAVQVTAEFSSTFLVKILICPKVTKFCKL